MQAKTSESYIKLNDEQSEIKLYPYRYLSLVVYCMMALFNAFAPQTFVAISIQIAQLYDQSSTILNMTALSYTLAHSFVVFPANFILDQMGLKSGLIIGSGFMILGYSVRILISQAFWLYILGTFITSLGFIFILNGATKFTNAWFGVKQTTFANTILLFLLFSSNALGIFAPVMFLDKYSNKEDVFKFVLYLSVTIISIHVIGLLVIRNKPPTPANHSSKKIKQKFLPSIKQLLKNKDYILLFLTIMTSWGCVSSFFVTLPYQLKPYGYDSNDVGFIILCANGLGLIGSVLIGLYVQKTKKYKKVLYFCIIAAILLVAGFLVAVQVFKTNIPLLIIAGFMGFSLFPFFTTTVDLSNQVAFPIGQATSSGFLLCGGQLFGFVSGLVLSYLFDGSSFWRARIGGAIYCLMFICSFLFLLGVKENLKKTKYENEKSEQSKDSLIQNS